MEYAARKSGLADLLPQLILEITERGVPDRLGVESLNQGLRVKVALDDVTLVGGANLAVLTRCNFHSIKLDKSLIDQIAPDRPAPEWLEWVGDMPASSQLLVVAEGVETEHQLTTLRDAKIQAAQGFYFARPMSAAALVAFHRERAIRQ
jgi:EAL domain-containing protein (putative c-di-GMP-specific phosphodiesterase class I)